MICRQFSSFSLDNDLAQATVNRVIEENSWMSQNWPQTMAGAGGTQFPKFCEDANEALQFQLAELKICGRYSKTFVERARIGIDEVGTDTPENLGEGG